MVAVAAIVLAIAYVVVTDEQQPIASVAAALDAFLRERLQTEWTVKIVIVPRTANPDERAPLFNVEPL